MGNAETREREAFREQIDAKNTIYQDAYINRKFEVIASLYTDDCRFMPAGFPIQMGPDNIAETWRKISDLGFHKLTFITQETIGPFKGTACERCLYWFEDKKGREIQRGKYIVVWKKVNGDWRYHFDIWNPDHMDLIKLAA